MAMSQIGNIRWLAVLLCFGMATPSARAASSNASAQIIIILPEREPSETPVQGLPETSSVPATSLREEAGTVMERSTTVIHDGDAIRVLHTEFAPL